MPSSARSTGSHRPPDQRQRKEKQFNATTTPDDLGTIRHGTAASTSQKGIACPKASPNRSRHRYADPRRARRATAPERAQAPFSLPPGAAHSLFGQDQKENGGRIPCGSRSLCSIPAPFHRSHKTTSAALSFCGRHRCHFHRSPWTIPLPDLRRRQRLPCAGIRCPGP